MLDLGLFGAEEMLSGRSSSKGKETSSEAQFNALISSNFSIVKNFVEVDKNLVKNVVKYRDRVESN